MLRRLLGRLFVAIDQLGNVFAGGHPDNTISARVGYFANYGNKRYQWYWKSLEAIINITFWPLDGKDHCRQAYFNDAGEKFEHGGYAWIYFILNILIILSCIPLFLIFYLLYILFLVSPKGINKLENLKNRLEGSERKLSGILLELEDTEVIGDDRALDLLNELEQRIHEIREKIQAKKALGLLNSSKTES